MKELQRWLDNAPTLRRCVVEFDGTWNVEVRATEASGAFRAGLGRHASLTFAVVLAITALETD